MLHIREDFGHLRPEGVERVQNVLVPCLDVVPQPPTEAVQSNIPVYCIITYNWSAIERTLLLHRDGAVDSVRPVAEAFIYRRGGLVCRGHATPSRFDEGVQIRRSRR